MYTNVFPLRSYVNRVQIIVLIRFYCSFIVGGRDRRNLLRAFNNLHLIINYRVMKPQLHLISNLL